MKYSNGDFYKGHYVKDKKEGFGVYYWPLQQSFYIGNFKDNLPNGFGM